MSEKENKLLQAQAEFRPVPASRRQSPGRVKAVPLRLYVERFKEHEQVMKFIEEVQSISPGEGSKTIVRSLIYYQKNIIEPLNKLEKEKGEPLAVSEIPRELRVAVREFTPLETSKKANTKVKQLSLRLSIDKWIEHRQAYSFLQNMQKMYGHGNRTIIKALLVYEKEVFKHLRKKIASASSKPAMRKRKK